MNTALKINGIFVTIMVLLLNITLYFASNAGITGTIYQKFFLPLVDNSIILSTLSLCTFILLDHAYKNIKTNYLPKNPNLIYIVLPINILMYMTLLFVMFILSNVIIARHFY